MLSYSQYVGDAVVRQLNIDFEARRTELQLVQWGASGAGVSIELVFVGVEFQQFRDLDDATVLMDLEEAETWAEFMAVPWHAQYIETRKNYLSSERLNDLAAARNRYFSLTSSCGFEAMVVCQELLLSNQPAQPTS